MCYPAGMPRSWSAAFIGICLSVSSGAQGEAQSGERVAVLAQLSRIDLRVGSLGFRLATANSQRCARQMPAIGLILHSIDQYRGAWREPALQVFGAIGGVSIEGVVAQSPSALAGIEPGDELIAINGKRLDSANLANSGSTVRRDRAEEALLDLPLQDPIRISVVRAGQAREFVLRQVPACRSRFEVVAGSARFARSDGRLIQLGQELIGQLSDEDIAFVLSHELAHSILDHRAQLVEVERQSPRNKADKRRSVLAREFEDQADRLAVQLMAQAGFDPWAAPRFMRRYRTSFDKASSPASIHRPAEERADLMEAEIARLKANAGG